MSQFDLILGQPWLTQYNPVINWKYHTVHYQHKLLSVPAKDRELTGTTNLLLASLCDIHLALTQQEGELFTTKVEKAHSEITEEGEQLSKWQVEIPEVFSPPKGLPPHRQLQHTIPMGDASPVACGPYCLLQPECKELERHLQELLGAGYI
jgi:hypothetical protein